MKGEPAGQMDAGAFYRSLIDAGMSASAARAAAGDQAQKHTAGAQPDSVNIATPTPQAKDSSGAGSAQDWQQVGTVSCDAAGDSAPLQLRSGAPTAVEQTAGLGSSARLHISRPWSAEQREQQAAPAVSTPSSVGPRPTYTIPHDNVGFRCSFHDAWAETQVAFVTRCPALFGSLCSSPSHQMHDGSDAVPFGSAKFKTSHDAHA